MGQKYTMDMFGGDRIIFGTAPREPEQTPTPNIGYLIRCEGDKFEVWDRDKKAFVKIDKIPASEYDGSTIEHLIDLYHIVRKHGIVTAFAYDVRSTKAHLLHEIFDSDRMLLNYEARRVRVKRGE